MTAASAENSLLDLVEHACYVDGDCPLETVQAIFEKSGHRYLAVVSNHRYLGMLASREIGLHLSMKYGLALFGRSPARRHLMAESESVTTEATLAEIFRILSDRRDERFYDDLPLLSPEGAFLGFIAVHRLVRLQHDLLLENIKQVEASRVQIELRNEQMQEDLKMAREVQLALLPTSPVVRKRQDQTYQIAHILQPAEVIGGDFMAILEPGKGKLGVIVCDVMGHGARSALITSILRALVEEDQDRFRSPDRLLARLNSNLISILHSLNDLIFVTAACAVADLQNATIAYSQAGHPAPVLWQEAQQSAAPLEVPSDAAGPALGVLEDVEFASFQLPFAPGDLLLLYTDGIEEVRSPSGEEFGKARLREALDENGGYEPSRLLSTLLDKAKQFANGAPFLDDVCLVSLASLAQSNPISARTPAPSAAAAQRIAT